MGGAPSAREIYGAKPSRNSSGRSNEGSVRPMFTRAMRILLTTSICLAALIFQGAPRAAGPMGASAAVQGGASSHWLAQAKRHIAEREYWASPSERGLQAPNRRHSLRTWFDGSGIRVHDRTADGSPLLVELGLSRLGRGERL